MKQRFRPGDYLIVDEISGLEIWASQAGYDWDGSIRDIKQFDGEHPDFFSRNYPEEKVPDMTNTPIRVTAFSSVVPVFVGNTTVTAPPGPTPNRFLD